MGELPTARERLPGVIFESIDGPKRSGALRLLLERVSLVRLRGTRFLIGT
jgi:hypothetical protein